MTDDVKQASERLDTGRAVVLSGWSLTVLVCVTVIGAAIFTVFKNGSVDPLLKEWGGTCLGFLFGAFVSLVKDFIKGP